jgi:hypothetical protein
VTQGHTPLALSKPGLSIADANGGRLITFEQDVLDIKAEIERIWAGVLSVFFDQVDMKWVIVEHCQDGTDRIAFKTEFLSQATIDKIHRIDQQSRSFVDPEKAYQQADQEEVRDKDHALSEKVGDAAEHLYHALRRDGVISRPQVHFSDRPLGPVYHERYKRRSI